MITDNLVKTKLSRSEMCKNSLTRLYYSKKLQFVYLLIIALCAADFIVGCIYISSGTLPVWFFLLDLILSCVMVADSGLRIYTSSGHIHGLRRLWAEVTVIILCIPDIVIDAIFHLTNPGKALEIASIVLIGLIMLIRPVVFWQYRVKSQIISIRLPNSVVNDFYPVRCNSKERIDDSVKAV